ncbi:hypothetical protein ACVGWR_00020, partial [Enterobacter hormaechei]
AEAAWHGCDLIVFPELSLTGPGGTSLRPRPAALPVGALLPAAPSRLITVLAGISHHQQRHPQNSLLYKYTKQRNTFYDLLFSYMI